MRIIKELKELYSFSRLILLIERILKKKDLNCQIIQAIPDY